MKLIEMDQRLEYADHAFGTAVGTESATDPEEIVRTYTETLGPIAHMRQVHGDRVVYANAPGLYEEADAIFTDQKDLWLAVKTADCVPVLVSCPNAVAAVHCGWRGLEEEILPKTIKILMDEYNITGVDIFIHIGPCISQENYEVDESYVEKFGKEYFRECETEGKVLMNMVRVVEDQARDMGVSLNHIYDSGLCTFSEKELLHSYRRNKEEGNEEYNVQLSLVRLLEGGSTLS